MSGRSISLRFYCNAHATSRNLWLAGRVQAAWMKLQTRASLAGALIATLLAATAPAFAELSVVAACDGLEGEERKHCLAGEDASLTLGEGTFHVVQSDEPSRFDVTR